MLQAAMLIDPDNQAIIKKITNLRDCYYKELIDRLEQDIAKDLPCTFEECEKLINSHRTREASKMVEDLYKEEPRTAEAYYLKGLLLYMTGGLTESLTFLDEALKIDNTHEKALKIKGNIEKNQTLTESAKHEMASKNYERAAELLSEVIKIDINNQIMTQIAYFERALAYFNAGEKAKAFEDYKTFELMKVIVGDVFKIMDRSKGKVADKNEQKPGNLVAPTKEENPKIKVKPEKAELEEGDLIEHNELMSDDSY